MSTFYSRCNSYAIKGTIVFQFFDVICRDTYLLQPQVLEQDGKLELVVPCKLELEGVDDKLVLAPCILELDDTLAPCIQELELDDTQAPYILELEEGDTLALCIQELEVDDTLVPCILVVLAPCILELDDILVQVHCILELDGGVLVGVL